MIAETFEHPLERQAAMIADLEAKLALADQKAFRQAAEIAQLRSLLAVHRVPDVPFTAYPVRFKAI